MKNSNSVTYKGSVDNPQICAECIFEEMTLGDLEFHDTKGSFEEARSFIEDYIEYN